MTWPTNSISGPYVSRCSFCDSGSGLPVAAAYGKVDRDHADGGSTMGVVLVCWRCALKLGRVIARGWLRRWKRQRQARTPGNF